MSEPVPAAVVGTIHVACASDARFLPHVATLLTSIAASNAAGSVRAHVLHDQTVTPEHQQQLRSMAAGLHLDVEFIEPSPEQVASLPPSGEFYPALIWYRMLLPELLGHLDRVLYLDADTLVLQDLRPLWSVPLGDALLAAVAQPEDGEHSTGARERMGLSAATGYFNSGVLLLNLDRMRAERFTQQIVDTGRAQSEAWAGSAHFRLPDQDALNLICAGRWIELHPRWNAFASLFLSGTVGTYVTDSPHFAEAVASPAVVHFEGSIFAKPWNYRCAHPLRHLYRAYRATTPWPLESLDGSGLAARILRGLPLRLQRWVSELKHGVLRAGRAGGVT